MAGNLAGLLVLLKADGLADERAASMVAKKDELSANQKVHSKVGKMVVSWELLLVGKLAVQMVLCKVVMKVEMLVILKVD